VPKPPNDPPVFRFFIEIGIIEQLARNTFERVMPGGLTLSQFSVLNHFALRGGAQSPLSLARAMQVSKGTMTNTLQKLEAKELIAIAPDPADGRGKQVSLTAAGLALRQAAIAALAPDLENLIEAFGERRFSRATPFLAEVREYLDRARDG
jgi:DNA-binding MarR family transcriptional regulator